MSLKDLQSLITIPEMSADENMICALGVRATEIEAYCTVVTGGASTVQEVADRLGKSRSTAQWVLRNLVDKGLANREEPLIGLGEIPVPLSARLT